MPSYDAVRFDPPAPVAIVALQNPATGASLSDISMLIDSGADVTLISREAIEKLEITSVAEKVYELQAFNGSLHLAETVQLELIFLGKRFKGQFLVIDSPIGIMGRNILNSIAVILDGPNTQWDEHKPNG